MKSCETSHRPQGGLKTPLSAGEGQGVGLIEQPIYGSSRIGMYIGKTKKLHRTLGNKIYELSNHLGNILATITDANTVQCGIYQTNGSLAKVISGRDYYAFGAAMPSRSYQDAGYSKYRYGFNGKENDGDIGEEISDFDNRLLNKENGRWSSPDLLAGKYPNMSPYSSMGNNPIVMIDPDGNTIDYSLLNREQRRAVKKLLRVFKSSDVYREIIKFIDSKEAGIYYIKYGNDEEMGAGMGKFSGNKSVIMPAVEDEDGEVISKQYSVQMFNGQEAEMKLQTQDLGGVIKLNDGIFTKNVDGKLKYLTTSDEASILLEEVIHAAIYVNVGKTNGNNLSKNMPPAANDEMEAKSIIGIIQSQSKVNVYTDSDDKILNELGANAYKQGILSIPNFNENGKKWLNNLGTGSIYRDMPKKENYIPTLLNKIINKAKL